MVCHKIRDGHVVKNVDENINTLTSQVGQIVLFKRPVPAFDIIISVNVVVVLGVFMKVKYFLLSEHPYYVILNYTKLDQMRPNETRVDQSSLIV